MKKYQNSNSCVKSWSISKNLTHQTEVPFIICIKWEQGSKTNQYALHAITRLFHIRCVVPWYDYFWDIEAQSCIYKPGLGPSWPQPRQTDQILTSVAHWGSPAKFWKHVQRSKISCDAVHSGSLVNPLLLSKYLRFQYCFGIELSVEITRCNPLGITALNQFEENYDLVHFH